MNLRTASLLLLFCGLLMMGQSFFMTGSACALTTAREVPIEVDAGLKARGIGATTATVQPENASEQPRKAIVFVTFERAFHGLLRVRGFRSDETETARSLPQEVNAVPSQGGHMHFAFDQDTSLEHVKRFVLEGTENPAKPRPKPVHQKGPIEEGKSIVKELLQ